MRVGKTIRALVFVSLLTLPLIALIGCGGKTPPTLSLTVTSPADGAELATSPVVLKGAVSDPEAVVTVNGELVEVDNKGKFSTIVALEEGPNAIEVVASSLEGEEVSAIITVIYAP